MYEIDCCVNDIADYIDKLSSNEHNLKKQFDPPAGGELGDLQSIFEKNLEVVKQVAEESKTKMHEDISLAWRVRDENEKTKQALEGKAQQLEKQVSQQKENVAAAEKRLEAAERNQTRVENTSTPSFANTEEGRAAKKQFEKDLANEKKSAQRAVNNAESGVRNAESTLKNLETSKANVERAISQIVENNKKLFEFIGKTQADITKFDSYVNQCERIVDSVKSCLESLSKDHKTLIDKTIKFKRKADEAQGLVKSIGTHLAKTADKNYNESDKVKVLSHDYLSNMSNSLDKTKSNMDKLNDKIDEIVKKFGDVLQDNVTKKTVSSVNGSSDEIAEKIGDFPSKAGHFRDAADYLYSYANL